MVGAGARSRRALPSFVTSPMSRRSLLGESPLQRVEQQGDAAELRRAAAILVRVGGVHAQTAHTRYCNFTESETRLHFKSDFGLQMKSR